MLDVRDRASFTDYMIFASGTSTRHVGSIAEEVIEEDVADNKIEIEKTKTGFGEILRRIEEIAAEQKEIRKDIRSLRDSD